MIVTGFDAHAAGAFSANISLNGGVGATLELNTTIVPTPSPMPTPPGVVFALHAGTGGAWSRPQAAYAYVPHALASAAANYHYGVRNFTVSRAGAYSLSGEVTSTSNIGFVALYSASFNASNPIANVVLDVGFEYSFSVPVVLSAGVTYFIVVSTFYTADMRLVLYFLMMFVTDALLVITIYRFKALVWCLLVD